MERHFDWRDQLLAAVDRGLRSIAAPRPSARRSPAAGVSEPHLSREERQRSEALMRVNHAGEVSAQALYMGQAVTARSPSTRAHLLDAAREERDHLVWCSERVSELGGRTSLIGPLWFAGSFCIGVAAGSFGDPTSLGFVTETERQVEAHLKDHLQRLPAADAKSRAILTKMAEDEAHHGTMATLAGGAPLPPPVKAAMAVGGEVLRRTAYFL